MNIKDYDIQINIRFFYSKKSLLYQSNHIQVFKGIDKSSNSSVFVRIVDEVGFNSKKSSINSRDSQNKEGKGIRNSEFSMFRKLKESNSTRLFTSQILDIIQMSEQKIAIIISATHLTTLFKCLENAQCLDEPDALLVLKYVASGINEIHIQGSVHGAICLENILVLERGINLTYLALKEYNSEKEDIKSKQNDSLCYLAPEILKFDNQDPDKYSDSWALGILFFRMLVGKFLYSGKTKQAVQSAIFSHKIDQLGWLDFIQENNGDFPRQISKQSETLLSKLLARDPKQRPTMQEVIDSNLLSLIRIQNKGQKASSQDMLKNLPPSISSSFTFFRESKVINDITGYSKEDLLFGLGKSGPSRLKIVQLTENKEMNGYYFQQIQQYRALEVKDELGRSLITKIVEVARYLNNVFIQFEYCNQSTLSEYLARRKNTNQKSVWKINEIVVMHRILNTILQIEKKIDFMNNLYSVNTFISNGIAKLGIPLIMNDQVLFEKKRIFDMIPPEFKSNQSIKTTDLTRANEWSFGILLYKIIFGDDPIFDMKQLPIFPQSKQSICSDSMKNVIQECLRVNPKERMTWKEIENEFLIEQQESNYNLKVYQIKTSQEGIIEGEEDDEAFLRQRKQPKQFNQLKISIESSEDITNPQKQSFQKKRNIKDSGIFSQKTAVDSIQDMTGLSLKNMSIQEEKEDDYIVLNQSHLQQTTSFATDFQFETQEDQIFSEIYSPSKSLKIKVNSSKNFNKAGNSFKGPFSSQRKLNMLKIINKEKGAVNESLITQTPPDQTAVKIKQKDLKPDESLPSIIPPLQFGGEFGRFFKIVIKMSIVILLFFFLFFRKSIFNSFAAMSKQNHLKTFRVNVVVGTNSNIQTSDILSENTSQFVNSKTNFSSIKLVNHCLDNLTFWNNTNQQTILDTFNSGFFFFYSLFCFLTFAAILLIKLYQIAKLDQLTVYSNYKNGLINPYNTYLLFSGIFSHFEFSFLYFCHYQIFNLFYYLIFDPCLGVEISYKNLPLLMESAQLSFGGRIGYFFLKIICTLGLFGLIHFLYLVKYLKNPIKMSKLMEKNSQRYLRLFFYLIGPWIICRIGALLIFQPTYAFDEKNFISSTLGEGEFQAVLGFIPELIEIIVIIVDLLIEVLFNRIGHSLQNNKNPIQSEKRKREEQLDFHFKQNPIKFAQNFNKNVRNNSQVNNLLFSGTHSFDSKSQV